MCQSSRNEVKQTDICQSYFSSNLALSPGEQQCLICGPVLLKHTKRLRKRITVNNGKDTFDLTTA